MIKVCLIVILVVLTITPIYILFQKSLFTSEIDGSLGVLTLDHYKQIFVEGTFFGSLINTFLFALGSAIVAIFLGTIQAWIVERTNTPMKTISYVGAILSLGIPYILYTVAWLLVFSKSGPVNSMLMTVFSVDKPLLNIYSLPGMILIEGFVFSPMAFLLLAASFKNVDSSLEEAARMSGAGHLSTIFNISLKLVLPAVLAMALLIFIRSFEAFEIPALVGLPGDTYVLTTRIFLDIHGSYPPDYGRASSFSIVLIFMVLFLLMIYNKITQQAGKYRTITGKGFRPNLIDLGKWRFLTSAIIILNFFLILVVPLSMVVWVSLLPFVQLPSLEALSSITFKNYVSAIGYPEYGKAIRNTIVLAVGTATIVMGITAFSAWFSARRLNGGKVLDQLSTLPLIFPGLVLAVAVMEIYVTIPLAIYGTLWILLIGFVTKYLPYGMRYNYAGILQIHSELEESAQISGASPLNTFRVIILPLLSPTFWAGWIFVLLMTARELALPVLLSSPQSRVVAVQIYDLWVNGQMTELAAFGIVWSSIMIFIAFVFFLLARRFGTSIQS